MALDQAEHTRISATVDAPAEAVYDLLTDLDNWPRLFPWILHTECLERNGADDEVRYWGVTDDEHIRTWVSRRQLDPAGLRMDFEQQGAVGEVHGLSGSWAFESLPDGRTQVESTHEFTVMADSEEVRARVTGMFAARGRRQIDRLTECAERRAEFEELTLSFADSIFVSGDLHDIYAVLRDAQRWLGRTARVERTSVTENEPGIQFLDMDTRGSDDTVVTSRSVRLCLPPDKIIYKQLVQPKLLDLHAGHWVLAEVPDGILVTAGHTAVIDPAQVRSLGPESTIAEARRYVRKTLGDASLAGLLAVKEIIEAG